MLAEAEVYRLLKELEKDDRKSPTTLVAIGQKIVFEGIWRAVNNGDWIFEINRFILGELKDLIEFNSLENNDYQKYIIIETQGDGRLLSGNLNWKFVDNKYEIT